MQKREFNELMKSEESSIVKAFKMQNEDANRKALAKLNQAMATGNMEEASKIVAENEVNLSQEETKEMRSYIKELEAQGLKQRTIRRKVKDKFGIIVVPNHKP